MKDGFLCLSRPSSLFSFEWGRGGGGGGRRAKKRKGKKNFPPFLSSLPEAARASKTDIRRELRIKNLELFLPFPLSFKLPSFPPSGAQTSEWKQRKRGSSSFPGFFPRLDFSVLRQHFLFPRRETGGSFFFPLLGRLRKKIGRKGRRENVKSRGKFFLVAFSFALLSRRHHRQVCPGLHGGANEPRRHFTVYYSSFLAANKSSRWPRRP